MRPQVKLGDRAYDAISGFTGIVVAITNWLNGCQRITIQPQGLHDGKRIESDTFDAEQIEVIKEELPRATRSTGGPSIAPIRNRDPIREDKTR